MNTNRSPDSHHSCASPLITPHDWFAGQALAALLSGPETFGGSRTWDEAAEKVVSMARRYADPTRAAAIQQMDVTTNSKGETITRIKLADKKAALVDLDKHLGLFESKPPEKVEEPDDVDDRKLAMAILAFLSEAANRSGSLIDGSAHIDLDIDDRRQLTFRRIGN